MNFQKSLAVVALALSLAAVGGQEAHAQSGITFANYSLTSTTGNVYSFTNAGAGSTLVTAPLNIPVDFSYNVPNGFGPAGTSIPAILNLSANAAAIANSFGPFDIQTLTNVKLSIISVAGSRNLLSIVTGPGGTPSTGNISGLDLDTRGTFGGSNARLDAVFFTSDYLNFAGTLAHNYAVSLTSITQPLSINGNGYLNTFQASGSGSFASTLPTPAPEPGSLLTLSILGGCLAFCIARRKTQGA